MSNEEDKPTFIGDRTFFSMTLLIPIAMAIGFWMDLNSDSKVHASQIEAVMKHQELGQQHYEKIMDALADIRGDLKTVQNQLNHNK